MGCSLVRLSLVSLSPGFIGEIVLRKPEMLDMGVKTVSRVIWLGNGPGFSGDRKQARAIRQGECR